MAIYIVLQSLFIYTLVGFVLYIGGRESYIKKSIWPILVAVIIYAIIFGLRYGVGVDTISYIESYSEYGRGVSEKEVEPGFMFLNQSLYWLGFPSWFFLTVVAFLQLGLVFLAYRREKNIYKYLALTFMLGCVWLSFSNGLRQILAFCFFIASVPLAQNKKFFWHYLLIALAISMHKSAWLLVIFYPLIRLDKDWCPSILIQYVLLAVAVALGKSSFFLSILGQFEQVAVLTGYDVYMSDGYYSDYVFSTDSSIGVGYIILLFIPIFIIAHSDYLKKKNPSVRFIYNLFFFGLLLRHSFEGSMLVQRINYYFYGFEFIVAAFLLYQFKIDHRKRSLTILVFLYCLVFLATLYRMFENSSAFFFIWQQEEYRQLIHR